jgi:hypothetical protein
MSAELMRSYLDILNEQQKSLAMQQDNVLSEDQLDEINRRDFLRGMGAAALGAAGLPQAAQASGNPLTNREFATYDPNEPGVLTLRGKRYRITKAPSDIDSNPPPGGQLYIVSGLPHGGGARSAVRAAYFMPNGVAYLENQQRSMRTGKPIPLSR